MQLTPPPVAPPSPIQRETHEIDVAWALAASAVIMNTALEKKCMFSCQISWQDAWYFGRKNRKDRCFRILWKVNEEMDSFYKHFICGFACVKELHGSFWVGFGKCFTGGENTNSSIVYTYILALPCSMTLWSIFLGYLESVSIFLLFQVTAFHPIGGLLLV